MRAVPLGILRLHPSDHNRSPVPPFRRRAEPNLLLPRGRLRLYVSPALSFGAIPKIVQILERRYGPIRRLHENGSAPADRYALPDGTIFGIISSTTEPFCRACDRSRLTADGVWFLCLYAAAGIDLLKLLRQGASDDELRDLIAACWSVRADRGAEERKALSERGPLYQIEDLRSDPHREMHTRGG